MRRMTALYVVLDPAHCLGRDPIWVAEQALLGGARVLQLREKQMLDGARLRLARDLRALTREHGAQFWLNDRADLAVLCEADGLHLGQDDLPPSEARRLVGDMRIGLSTHSLAQVRAAASCGVQWIGFGPVFDTRSKENPDATVGTSVLAAACATSSLPVVAIGGISVASAREVAEAGASYAAVIGAVCGAEDPRQAARALCDALTTAR